MIAVMFAMLSIAHAQEAVDKFNNLKDDFVSSEPDKAEIVDRIFAMNGIIVNDSIIGENKEMTFPIMVLFASKDDFSRLYHSNSFHSFINSNILYDNTIIFRNGVKVQKVIIREEWFNALEEDEFVMKDILAFLENTKFN